MLKEQVVFAFIMYKTPTLIDIVCRNDILTPLNDELCTHLPELMPSEKLLSCNKKELIQNPMREEDFRDVFGSDLVGYISKMTEYWEQFGFFDKKPRINVVSDLSRLSLACVTQTVVPIDDESDEKDQYEYDDEYTRPNE